jgi:hypothetical protein
MGYKVLGRSEDLLQGYEARKGLEGPFVFPNLRVVYYDPREGAYWDPRTDFYLSHDEAAQLQNSIFDTIRG